MERLSAVEWVPALCGTLGPLGLRGLVRGRESIGPTWQLEGDRLVVLEPVTQGPQMGPRRAWPECGDDAVKWHSQRELPTDFVEEGGSIAPPITAGAA
ncbi:hypothetical protein NDU88_004517 [Pleurodeles waltl]|uniref:Uncharacterized protein n=1 Tax=Pleurodeles waltl TaxID=8319 RepID=A0AAV7VK42_PLEWA|nr:hypothetical protein NDU88_004517 [Pleurodeles waltl]